MPSWFGEQARLTRVATSFKQRKKKTHLSAHPPHARYLPSPTVTASSLHPECRLSFELLTFLSYNHPPSPTPHAFTDVAVQLPDKKSIIMYVTSLFAVLPKDVSMDAIREVETLPRKYKVEAEDVGPGHSAQVKHFGSVRRT